MRLRRSRAPDRLGLAQFLAHLPCAAHGALDEGVLRVLGEEQHHLAAGTLPGIAVLQPPREIAKHRLATRALDLDGTHTPTNNGYWKSAATVSGMSEETLNVGCKPIVRVAWNRRYCFAAIVSRQ